MSVVSRRGQSALPLVALCWLVLASGGCGEEEKTLVPAQAVVSQEQQPAAATAETTTRPNVVLITMDTTRADALGAYGQKLRTTPNVDRLARKGVLFEQVATVAPETLPSHSTIFTGKWPFVHGVRANAGYVLSDRNVTLAEALRSHGYATGAEIAATVLRHETQVAQGFDHYRGPESSDVKLKTIHYSQGEKTEEVRPIRIGGDITNRGIEFLHENRQQRFFLWLHYFDSHHPYWAPADFRRRFPDAPYHAEVASADLQIGRFMRELKKLGLAEQTLVVLTADHGEGLSEHGEPSHSFYVYDTTMRVPLIVAGIPSLPSGLRIPSLVRTVDIAPTILDLLELPPLEDIQGVSLVPLIEMRETDLELAGYGEATRFTAALGLPTLRFLRRGAWKYIHKINPELYNVVDDPGELENLASQQPEMVERLRGELEELLRNAPEQPDDAQADLDAQTAAQLIALGYIARSPAFAIPDELTSLELTGDDPNTKAEDVQAFARVGGLIRREEFSRALPLAEKLHERNPEAPYVLDLEAQALIGLGRHKEGIALYRLVVSAEPTNTEALYSLASALQDSGQNSDAKELLSGLLESDPCDERFSLQMTALLREEKLHGELLRLLADGAEECPEMLSHRNNYAWALATLPEDNLRDGNEAVRVIRALIEMLPDAGPAYFDTLGAALAESGDFEDAIRATSDALARLEAIGASSEILDEVEGHLAAYREGRPVRDPSAEAP